MSADSLAADIQPPATETRDRPTPKRSDLRRAAEGFILGGLAGAGLDELVLQGFGANLPLVLGCLGAVIAVTRLRPILWIAAAFLVATLLIVGYTPLAKVLAKHLDRPDTLRPVPAIVVLGGGARADGTMLSGMQERAIHGYLLAKRGLAPRIVTSRPVAPAPPWDPVMRRQLDDLGLSQIALDYVGPVVNTHDEAVGVAKLMKEKGWTEVILVTHPWHMKRAAAVFEKAGVRVICSSCVEGQYDPDLPNGPRDRIGGFRHWLYETIGYQVYRNRGWI